MTTNVGYNMTKNVVATSSDNLKLGFFELEQYESMCTSTKLICQQLT